MRTLLNAGEEAVSLWIVEDDRDFRESLAAMMDGSRGLRCEQQFSNCETALKLFAKGEVPELVLMDIHLGPGMNGIEGVRRMKAISPATDIIMLTNYEDDHDVFHAICAGADGYLKKNSSLDETIVSITEVLSGGPPMNPHIARKAMLLFRKFAAPKDLGLTPREEMILKLCSEGHTKKTAAQELFITRRTVEQHIKNVYKKLNVHSMGEAVRIWLQSNPNPNSLS
jgi:DNA-binding NarL/FixJ family response regulator